VEKPSPPACGLRIRVRFGIALVETLFPVTAGSCFPRCDGAFTSRPNNGGDGGCRFVRLGTPSLIVNALPAHRRVISSLVMASGDQNSRRCQLAFRRTSPTTRATETIAASQPVNPTFAMKIKARHGAGLHGFGIRALVSRAQCHFGNAVAFRTGGKDAQSLICTANASAWSPPARPTAA